MPYGRSIVLAGRGRTRCGHQNQRPSSAAIDGVMNERTIRVSNSRPSAIVVPTWAMALTAAYAVAPIIARFVAEAGSERILMGTDLPWFDPMFCIGCILFSEIDDAARANILYRNAARLFPSVSALLHHS